MSLVRAVVQSGPWRYAMLTAVLVKTSKTTKHQASGDTAARLHVVWQTTCLLRVFVFSSSLKAVERERFSVLA
jgi:hypothetical protein